MIKMLRQDRKKKHFEVYRAIRNIALSSKVRRCCSYGAPQEASEGKRVLAKDSCTQGRTSK